MAFTVHGIDSELDRRLAERARQAGISKNQLVKVLLAKALGLGERDPDDDDYREFVGVWSGEDKAEFDRSQKDNTAVMDGDWK